MKACEHRNARYVIPPRGWFVDKVESLLICNNPHCQAVGVRFKHESQIHWRSANGKITLSAEKLPQKRSGLQGRKSVRRKVEG